MFKALGQALAPGLSCTNDSDVPILFVLSQLSPLHWMKIAPGRTRHINCGQVYFTVSVEPWVEDKEPTQAEVVARLAVVVGSTLAFGGMGLVVTGVVSGITSYHGTRQSGYLANGRTIVVKGKPNEEFAGRYDLYFYKPVQKPASAPVVQNAPQVASQGTTIVINMTQPPPQQQQFTAQPYYPAGNAVQVTASDQQNGNQPQKSNGVEAQQAYPTTVFATPLQASYQDPQQGYYQPQQYQQQQYQQQYQQPVNNTVVINIPPQPAPAPVQEPKKKENKKQAIEFSIPLFKSGKSNESSK